MKNTKIYYSVKYFAGRGPDGTNTAYFDNKEKADQFASADYRDNPVAHRLSSPASIDKYDQLVALTEYEANR